MKRDATTGSFPFMAIFRGFESLDVVKAIFGDRVTQVLTDLRVDVQARGGYLRVDDETGNIIVNGEYLKIGDERYLYLDVIHELVHVKQFLEGKELFDRRYSYVDRSTEIDAYRTCINEGKRLGMSDREMIEYLKVEWVTEEEFTRLIQHVGIGTKISSQVPSEKPRS